MRSTTRPRQLLELYGRPIIVYILEVSQSYPDIDAIIVPYVDGWHDHLRDTAQKFGITKLLKVVPGGKTSQESKLSTLHTLKDIYSDRDIILMRDVARLLITPQAISDNITSVKIFDSTITVNPSTETGIISSDDKTVKTMIKRQRLYIAKAPQSFHYCDVLTVHEAAADMPDLATVDVYTIITTLGKQLCFVLCDRCNIKITTPEGYCMFKTIYDLWESQDALGT